MKVKPYKPLVLDELFIKQLSTRESSSLVRDYEDMASQGINAGGMSLLTGGEFRNAFNLWLRK